jgi:hypothetical protein
VNFEIIAILIYVALVVVGVFAVLKLTKNKTRRVSTLRVFIQVVAVGFIFMGLIIGPFNVPTTFGFLGTAPRARLFGNNILGSQFPDGLSVPILAC